LKFPNAFSEVRWPLRRYFAALLFLAIPAAAGAEPVRPDDFAYGLRLRVRDGGAIHRLILPPEIYRGATRSDLGDLRVFNAEGRPVPHTVRRPPSRDAGSDRPVPFFPLYEDASEDGGLSLEIVTDAKGAVIRTAPRPGDGAETRVAAYLIDLEDGERAVSALRLDWTGGGESFAVDVAVSASPDLNRWRVLVPSASLVRLRYGGHRLGRNAIPLPRNADRYLRLSWPAETGGAELSAVRVESFSSDRPRRRQASARGTPDAKTPGQWHFDLLGFFPAERVQLELAETNSLVRGEFRSRPEPEASWRYRARGLFFRLMLEGEEIAGEPLDLNAVVADRHWMFAPADESGAEIAPALVLDYVPHELLFLARGEGPFLLAYGSAVVGPAVRPVDELVRALGGGSDARDLAAEAEIGEAVSLGGSEMLAPPFPLRQWTLWSVLVAGVFLVAFMAWRLWRQMARGPDAGDGN
jgi:hypothetical protein